MTLGKFSNVSTLEFFGIFQTLKMQRLCGELTTGSMNFHEYYIILYEAPKNEKAQQRFIRRIRIFSTSRHHRSKAVWEKKLSHLMISLL